MDAARIEAQLRGFFAADPCGVIAAYLFGSVARGTCRRGSDVDVAVLHAQPPQRTLDGLPLQLEGRLESLLGFDVQVTVLNLARPDLIHRVLRDGRLLLDADRAIRIGFEVQARNAYFDLEPVRRRYRRLTAASSR